MNMNRNEDFFNRNFGKVVHVDFINFKGNLTSAVGKLSSEVKENKEGDFDTLVTVESDTDFNVIPLTDIKKIFVKE